MRVVWSETAERELSEIFDHLAEAVSSEAAMQIVERILSRGEQMAAFPRLLHQPVPYPASFTGLPVPAPCPLRIWSATAISLSTPESRSATVYSTGWSGRTPRLACG